MQVGRTLGCKVEDKPCIFTFTRMRRALLLRSNDFQRFAGTLEQNERKGGQQIGTIGTVDVHKVELIQERERDLYRIDMHLAAV
mmetsp:Transcript_1747/g.3873  ORF Transcript_1747/g.3873 Transcript_1747/m.3873 type:complete len:84 (-) Transcript_1747:1764-2015(-)